MTTKDRVKGIKPVSEKNLDGYGSPPIAWDRAVERLEQEWRLQPPPEFGGVPEPHTHWLATTRPDGRPHVMPVGVVWLDGRFYFSSGASTRKAKNLGSEPALRDNARRPGPRSRSRRRGDQGERRR